MSLLIDGERTSGQDVRTQNVTSCLAISNIVKSSLGPVGLDKMLVDEIGDVTITNDGATILRQLEVEHPAAKVLVELAARQDAEVGDGTTSVVIVAAELLKRANELVKQGIHPTTVISGYRIAMRQAVKFIKSHLVISAEQITRDVVVNAAKTSMSSKIIGTESTFFAEMVVRAIELTRKRDGADGGERYSVSAINVIKVHGRSSTESELVDGFALNIMRSAQGMPLEVQNPKIALLDFNLQKHRMQMGVDVMVKDIKEIERISKREADITKERITKLLDAGAKVFVTTKAIDDLCAKYLIEGGAMGFRRVQKKDLQRLAKATGGKILTNLADLDGEEVVNAADLGECKACSEEQVGDTRMTYFKACAGQGAATIILRGANEFMLDEVDRSMHDSLMVVKRTMESRKVVAGGGSVESACSIHLDHFATTLGTREQLAVQQFSEALLVIPKTLAVNAAKDAPDLVAKLCAMHNMAQRQQDKAHLKYRGLNLIEGKVIDTLAAGCLEPALAKVKALRFATEAAITILRIDDYIKVNPQEDPRGGR